MIVVDTNVLSELVRPRPDQRVLAWFGSADQNELRISVVTVAELLAGANRLDDGVGSDRKADLILEMIAAFHWRTLDFEMTAATECANVSALRMSEGRPIALPDAMIAGPAIAAEADAIATRDRGFIGVGIPVVDPWSG